MKEGQGQQKRERNKTGGLKKSIHRGLVPY
jgi:hypothetical protein